MDIIDWEPRKSSTTLSRVLNADGSIDAATRYILPRSRFDEGFCKTGDYGLINYGGLSPILPLQVCNIRKKERVQHGKKPC